MLLQASEAIIALLLLSSVSDDQKATSTLITHTIVVRVMYNHWLDVVGVKWGWVRCVRVRVRGYCYILGSKEWHSQWEHPPPTNVAQVQILASKPCVGWVCCWFSPYAPRGFSPGTPVFPSPQKPTFPNSNSTRKQVDKEPLCGCATSKSLFIYLFICLFITFPRRSAYYLCIMQKLNSVKNCFIINISK